MPDSSVVVALGRVIAGWSDTRVAGRRATSAVAWGRCHLVCHWRRGFPSEARSSIEIRIEDGACQGWVALPCWPGLCRISERDHEIGELLLGDATMLANLDAVQLAGPQQNRFCPDRRAASRLLARRYKPAMAVTPRGSGTDERQAGAAVASSSFRGTVWPAGRIPSCQTGFSAVFVSA